jgi:Mn2+/Fe2+ NRAMP family transporter
MFGTIIAVFDGYSRSIERVTQLLRKKTDDPKKIKFKKTYELSIFSLATGSLIVVYLFENNLKELVDFATAISFLIAPIIAIFNFRLVTGKYFVKDAQPPIWLKILSYAGIIFLIGFAALFIITRFYNVI